MSTITDGLRRLINQMQEQDERALKRIDAMLLKSEDLMKTLKELDKEIDAE